METIETAWRNQCVKAHRSRWSTTKHIEMAYSYLRAGGESGDRAELARGEHGLHLAGEACSPRWPGSMHGAWFSGEAAAESTARGGGAVMIIGAGLAGIAAARYLREHGVESFILEADTHAYGRAWSNPREPYIDGGMWLHGCEQHPLGPHIEAAGIGLVRDRWEVREGDPADWAAATYQSGGILEPDRHRRLLHSAGAIETALDGDRELGGNLIQRIERATAQENDEDRSVLHTWMRTLYGALVAGDMSDLSVEHRLEPFALEGADAMLTGPVSATDLTEGLAISYNCAVQSLRRNKDGWVAVCEGGATYEAAQVICTAPIAVLNRIEFDPPLSAAKRNALARIGAGRVEKLWLTFAERCWGEETHFHIADGAAVCNVFIDASDVTGEPTLLTFIPHDAVAACKALPLETLAHIVLDDLLRSGAISLTEAKTTPKDAAR
jgi:predicted NAD/FAD-dependent oxidoreductase